MKLVAFAVKNYRSIQSTPRIELSDLTVLVGPNNEGKSNLLSALVCALTLAQERDVGVRRTLLGSNSAYDYDRDFPVGLRESTHKLATKFDLEFELDAADQTAFKAAAGSKLNGTLPIEISVGRDGVTSFDVKKQGPVKKALATKRKAIGAFIAERLQFQYIEAVRDEAQSRAIEPPRLLRRLLRLRMEPRCGSPRSFHPR